MTKDAVSQAQWGDLAGLSFAGIARMSRELPDEDDPLDAQVSGTLPRYGSDIKGRETQEEDCEGYVARRNGRYVYTYEEPATSAWKRRRVTLPDGTVAWRVSRPVFESALEDLKRGVAPNGEPLDGLIVYDLDRLTRDNRHLEDAIDVVVHHRRPILDTTGSIDLLTENGRSMARVLVTMSAKQSADTARRVQRKHQAMQQAGIPAGGRRPFGWQQDKRHLKPEEADEIRKGVERILDGAPPSAVVVDWNERGITTVGGKPWGVDTLKLVLRNPRICGYRGRWLKEYNPETQTQTSWVEIVTDANGDPVIGQWDRILTVEAWEAVTAIIGERYAPARGKNSRKYLLTGILRCGRDDCNTRLRASKPIPSDTSNRKFHYGCPGRAAGGCGGVGISGPPTDKHITEAVIAKYEEEAARRPEPKTDQTWEGEERLAQVRKDLREMTISWRSPGGMSGARYFALLPQVEAEEKELEAARQTWLARTHAVSARPTNIRAEWNSYSLTQQRAYIEDVLLAVIVKPANGRHGHYGDRLVPIWREDD